MELNGVEVVSPNEIAERFGVSLPAVYVWARQTDFPTPVLTMGGETRKRHLYSYAEVSEWVNARLTTKAGRGQANLLGRRLLRLATVRPDLFAEIQSILDKVDTEIQASMERHPAGNRL